jgi:hypothetical protein
LAGDITVISFLSALEAYIGVICACLPRIYILFARLYHKQVILAGENPKTDPLWSVIRTVHTLKDDPHRTLSDPGRSLDAGDERVARPRSKRRSSAPAKSGRWSASKVAGSSEGGREEWRCGGRMSSRRRTSRSGSLDSLEAVLYEIAAVSVPHSTSHRDNG